MNCAACGEITFRRFLCPDCEEAVDNGAYERSEEGQRLAP